MKVVSKVLAVLVGTTISLPATALEYRVQTGDTLSQIARHVYPGRVYGRGGSLETILKRNQSLRSNIDKIRPGTLILIETEMAADISVAVAPARRPASETIEPLALAADDQQASHLRIGPRFNFYRIDASNRSTGGGATLASTLSLGADLTWRQTWTEQWSSEAAIGFDKFETQTANIAVEPSSFTNSFFSISLVRHFKQTSAVDVTLGAESSPFARAVNSQNVALDAVTIPYARMRFSHVLASGRLFLFSIGADGGYRFASSQAGQSVNAGSEFGAFAQLHQTRGSLPLDLRVTYRSIRQDATLTTQSESVLGFTLGADFDVGGRSEGN